MIMRRIVAFLIVLVSAIMPLTAEDYRELFSVGNPIDYCGEKFYFAYSVTPRYGYYLQEYLPEGQSFDDFKQMFSVAIIFGNETPEAFVANKIAELEERKKTDPVINYIAMQKDDNHVLDFIVSQGDGEKVNVVEENVYCYRQVTIGGRQAVMLCFLSDRAYGDDILPFIKDIPNHWVERFEGMAKLRLSPEMIMK